MATVHNPDAPGPVIDPVDPIETTNESTTPSIDGTILPEDTGTVSEIKMEGSNLSISNNKLNGSVDGTIHRKGTGRLNAFNLDFKNLPISVAGGGSGVKVEAIKIAEINGSNTAVGSDGFNYWGGGGATLNEVPLSQLTGGRRVVAFGLAPILNDSYDSNGEAFVCSSKIIVNYKPDWDTSGKTRYIDATIVPDEIQNNMIGLSGYATYYGKVSVSKMIVYAICIGEPLEEV